MSGLWRTAILGRCPACRKGSVFQGLLTMREQCPACGLRVGAREQGDGPAFFGIVIIGALATVGAAVVEMMVEPPYWVHAAIWPLFIVVGSIACLRVAKAMMLSLQYMARPQDFK